VKLCANWTDLRVNRLITVATGLLCLVLVSCGTIPGAGPFNGAISSNAEIEVSQESEQAGKDNELVYALIEVTKPIVSIVNNNRTFLKGDDWPNLEKLESILINIGDTLNITIYEAKSGGLFVPREAGVRPGNFITLPPQIVDSTGSISVPYVGSLKVVGLTSLEIQDYIVEKLKDRAIDPQALVTFGTRGGSEVSILGEVNSPKRYSLNFNGETVLDAIARAGGPKAPGYESYVTLQRGGKEQTLLLDTLFQAPEKNIFLQPNDIIYVYRQPDTYTVFGAADNNGRHEFSRRKLNLSEAIGKADGLNNLQADASEIFVFRRLDKNILLNLIFDDESKQAKLEKFGQEVETVFHFNLREPKGFFLTQSFAIQDNDIIFIPDADTVDLLKFISVISPTSGTAITIKALN
jgi:polysaccharide export outer membrane protein